MTWDNYMLAFDELGMPRPERPTEEFFVDMRGVGIPNTPADVEGEQGTDEEDYWTESEDDSENESDS